MRSIPLLILTLAACGAGEGKRTTVAQESTHATAAAAGTVVEDDLPRAAGRLNHDHCGAGRGGGRGRAERDIAGLSRVADGDRAGRSG